LKHRTVLKRESLAQLKAEREEAKPNLNAMYHADMKESVRHANELESERGEVIMGMGKEKDKNAMKNERGCFGGVMRLFGRELR
jgi:hypothetical protein